MSIRNRLIAAIVGVALVAGFLFSAFTYQDAAQTLERMTLRQLENAAAAKARELERLNDGWRTTTRLIAGSRALRASVDAYFVEPSTRVTELPRIDGILSDAMQAGSAIKRITVYDRTGERATSVGSSAAPATDALTPSQAESGDVATFRSGEAVDVVHRAALTLESRSVGAIEIVFDGRRLNDLTADSGGLGDAVEVLVVLRDAERARLLTDLAHPGDWQSDSPLAVAALRDTAGTLVDTMDYRGVPVMAATQPLPTLDWSVVVTIEAAEARNPARALRDRLTLLGVALLAAAIGAALWLVGRILPPPEVA